MQSLSFLIPAARHWLTRSSRNPYTSSTTFAYSIVCCIVRGSPCICIRQIATEDFAKAGSTPSSVKARMSFIISAPAAIAAFITTAELVSTEIHTSMFDLITSTIGITRLSCSSSDTAAAPGRVDSPPTSKMSAPAATIDSARCNVLLRSTLKID